MGAELALVDATGEDTQRESLTMRDSERGVRIAGLAVAARHD